MKKLVTLLFVALFAFSASAVTLSQVQQLGDSYNAQVEEAPGFLKNLVGDQLINLNVETSNQTFSVNMTGASIAEISNESFEQPTLEIWIEDSDIETVSNSTEPLQKTSGMLKNGTIEYQAHGFVNSLKFSLVELFI